MKKISKTEQLSIEKILGFRPNAAMLSLILKDAQEKGCTVTEAAAQRALPDIKFCEPGEPDPQPQFKGHRIVVIRGENE